MSSIYVIGTLDTKSDELTYACERIRAADTGVVLVDVGTRTASAGADVAAAEVAAHHPDGADAVLKAGDRGAAVAAMGTALARFLSGRADIAGVLGLGGTGNTALVTQGMRALPVGMPKVMVSTVASGNTAPYVGPNDITMMYSVVDVAGLNPISRRIIENAAHAVTGMVAHHQPDATSTRPAVGLTMFGVTTDCVNQVRKALEASCDTYVFHATGVGGQTMEKLLESGLIGSIVDTTTTEVADLLVGGVFAATEDRFGAMIRGGRPYVGSVGAVDMVNFGAPETVPSAFRSRNLFAHNPQVTLMRTTPDENSRIGQFIVERLNQMQGPVRFLLPLGGVSAIDAPGQPFHDPDADAALFDAIRHGWQNAPNRQLIECNAHINDPAFADALVANHSEITVRA
ncbi:Tm-1-like ATP-binding domain-containing protein [Devosia ginsengisoli]|uniref:UPF0261 family protein n=1 Tax=Devosia ginsengisoli TaxID=400770 RepID=A0A5B8LW38_9HYPH|nr:Tm-1-like ATP-binding domain-containing protein [Devosia ginsengisoli]QDZ12588.1 UPF0261 family protein [Devosia ginsengisoli]